MIDGFTASSFRENTETTPIVLRAKEARSNNFEEIENAKVYSLNSGKSVNLSQIADIKFAWEPSVIYRTDSLKTITVTSEIYDDYNAINIVNTDIIPWLNEQQKEWGYGFSYEIGIEENNGDKELIDNKNFSRGYEIPDYKKSIKNSFDYYYPIAYPDWGGKGFFLKRVTGDLFYDNTLVKMNENKNYDSLGNEFNFDLMLFSVLSLNLQFQYAYLLDKNEGNISLGFKLNM